MASKHILTSFLLVSSWVFVGYSQPSCVQKLLPCQAYLKAPSTPTAECCVPLKEMVSGDPKCLCDVFDNPDLLKSLNVTQDDAMKLAKACNVNADVSVCKKEASPPTASPPTSDSSSSNNTSNSTPKGAAYGFSHFGVSGFAAFIVALSISAFQA